MKRIPTILALIILSLAVGFTVFATQKVSNLFTKAATGSTPKNIRVTNITDTSFTVSYLTDSQVKGSVSIDGGVTFPDDRDAAVNQAKTYITHYVTLKNLTPATVYKYKVEGGTSDYEVTTGPTITVSATTAEPIYGTVVKTDGTPAVGAIVYFSPFGGSPISTYVKANGNFLLPVNNIRTTNLKSYLLLRANDPETIFIEGANDGVSTVSCLVGKDKPIPNIILGKDVSCSPPAALVSPELVTISSPTEGEVLTTGLPTFRGKAPAGKTVQIEVRSSPVTGVIKTDSSGNWVWPIPSALDPGTHVATISYLDTVGSTKTIIRNFSVKGSSVETAILPQTYGTPSAAIKISPTPVPTKVVYQKPPTTGTTENLLILLTAGVFLVTLGASTIYKALWTR